MTAGGYEALEHELRRLKSVERPRIIQAISEARSHGDLSENAEYHAAKEQQGYNEARVAEIEEKLGRAEVIDPSKLDGDRIMFGATVTLVDEDTEAFNAIMAAFRLPQASEADKAARAAAIQSATRGATTGELVR